MKTKVSIKVKGSPKGVKKALNNIIAEPTKPGLPLREADFRRNKK